MLAGPLLRTLHWLPVQQRIDYKVALLTFKVRSTSTPSYLRLLIQDREHGHNLRSTTTALRQPFTTTIFAKRAFRCSAPAVWNSLPKIVLNSDSLAVFKSRLKTFLFSQAFPSLSAHYYGCYYYYYYYCGSITIHTTKAVRCGLCQIILAISDYLSYFNFSRCVIVSRRDLLQSPRTNLTFST